jgi:hypothetical protein
LPAVAFGKLLEGPVSAIVCVISREAALAFGRGVVADVGGVTVWAPARGADKRALAPMMIGGMHSIHGFWSHPPLDHPWIIVPLSDSGCDVLHFVLSWTCLARIRAQAAPRAQAFSYNITGESGSTPALFPFVSVCYTTG